MIPVLFAPGDTNFATNGIGFLIDAIQCNVTEVRNGEFELSMRYPTTGAFYSDIVVGAIIKARPSDGKDAEPFRIYKISKAMGGVVTIYAEHISYMLSQIVVMPFSAQSCAEALRGFKLNSVGDNPFTFETDKEIPTAYNQTVPATIRARLGGEDGSILDTYKGELEYTGYTVHLWKNRGSDKGVEIRYGKNLVDVTQEESIQATYTGIVPYWVGMDGDSQMVVTLPPDNPAVYSETAKNFPYQKTIVVDFSDRFEQPPTEDELRAKAEAYVIANKIGIPEVNLSVRFAALNQSTNYADISALERINLCDTVSVYFSALGVSAKAEVIATDYNVLLDRYDLIQIGDARTTLADTIASTDETIKEAVKDSKSAFDAAISHASALLSGALGGHVVISTNAQGQPNEILIMDTDTPETAVNVIRLNEAGIGFSKSGYNGPFTSAWTIDGTFDAQAINVINFMGQYLTAGVISDAQHRNYWNLDTGVMELNAASASVGGSPVETEKTTAELRDGVITLQNHLKWDPNRGLSITTNEGLEVLLTAQKMSFLQNNTEVAYISNQELYITDANVLRSITIGTFRFVPRVNGNLSLVYIGD